ncbi:MAG: flippase-like domain-containing protein, partial [Marichromatium sp.]|nr:flippase-like domain-containing protein [Marichromatium sp.]
KIFIEVIFLTVIGIVLDGLYFYLMFKAFGFTSINVAMIFIGYTLLNLSYILPQPPGQMGSNELLMSLIFVTGMGMNYADAGSLIAVAHLLTGAVVASLGIISLSVVGVRIIDLIDRSNNE